MIPKALPATSALIAISLIVYLLMSLGLQDLIVSLLLISEYYQPVLPEISHGQLWRLFTPMFLHFSIFHIVFNLLWVWELGRIIEWHAGPVRLLVLALFISLAANLAQYLVNGPLFGGMSGIIYGYFGYIWVQSKTNSNFGFSLNPAVVKLMVGWFILCWTGILNWALNLNIANTAHTAGLICGILLAFTERGISRLKNK